MAIYHSDDFPPVDQRHTSPLRQTCAGCGEEIGACEVFVRDSRDEPWHPRCKAIAAKWLADAQAEIADLRAELAKHAAIVAAAKAWRKAATDCVTAKRSGQPTPAGGDSPIMRLCDAQRALSDALEAAK